MGVKAFFSTDHLIDLLLPFNPVQLHSMEGSLFQRIHSALQPGSQESPHSGSPLFDDQLARRLAHIAGRATPSSELRTRPPSVNSHGAPIDEDGSVADSGHQSMLHSYASRNHSYSLSADLIQLQHIVKDLKEQQDNFGKTLPANTASKPY